MNGYDLAQFIFFAALLISLVPILGKYMADIFLGNPTFMHPVLGWLERICYQASGVNQNKEMRWKEYLKTLLLFNFFGFAAVFLLQMLQHYLPLNPQNFRGVDWSLAFNTAVSFATNTNWQAYVGESTLSYTTQMLGLAVQNFLSAATGLAVALVLIRGISRKPSETLGNFWVDLVRSVIYLLLPLSIVMAVVLVSQGVIQNFSHYVDADTLENGKQTIPMGPVASQIAIKQLGTNGGGFFNANSAHPFENPNAITNFLETLALVLIPASLTYTYGIMVGSKKHGWLLFLVMFVLWIGGIALATYSELIHNPVLAVTPNLEGHETRFGSGGTLLWTVTTTATANGSVNGMISSLSPLAGGIAMFNIMVGELIFGGVGVGLCSMIMFALLTVFLSGLMVGRTPEYFGKKIEKREVQWVMLAVLIPGVLVLSGAGISSAISFGLSGLGNQGPHGLSEILYAFVSTGGNNGSSFAGLNANTVYYNLILGITMIMARLGIVVPSVAIAGLLVKKKSSPISIGSFSTDTYLFAILLISVITIVGALTFFPALSLGPIVEHLLMLQGRSF